MLPKENDYFIVAEDDPDDTLLLKDAFMEIGENIPIFVDNGKALLDRVNRLIEKNIIPKLLMIDLNMPMMDGKSVVKQLKSNAETSNIPLVILSTSKNKADVETLKMLGADDFFSKPSSYKALVDIAKSITTKWLNV